MKNININQLITDKLIEQLRKGVVQWRKPWIGTWNGAYSRVMKKPYSLSNQLLLDEPGEYLTYTQITNLGGNVKKGEKASVVVFWKPIKIKSDDEDEEEKTIPLLRYYHVFHINQTEGIKPLSLEEQMEFLNPNETAEKVIENYISNSGVIFESKLSDRACYEQNADKITVPAMEQYTDIGDYYSTVFHEIIHSTGHKDRLNRLVKGALLNDRDRYAKEELIAEIGAASLCHNCNVETPDAFENSVAYINGWLKALENDERLIIQASSKSQKAVEYVLKSCKDEEEQQFIKAAKEDIKEYLQHHVYPCLDENQLKQITENEDLLMRIINNIYDEAYKHEIDIDYAVIFTFQELLDIDLTD